MKTHYTEPYLLYPVHKVTVDLVGMGGTGSQMLTGLARINLALMKLGHPGLHVRAWDDDVVTDANISRQLFSPADMGINKAVVLISRVNRYFGFDWEAVPEAFAGQTPKSNITVTCVDSAKARLMIGMWLTGGPNTRVQQQNKRYYWLDLGNLSKTGQVVLGTLTKIKQPPVADTKDSLPDVIKKFPLLKKLVNKEHDLGPSCSLAEALEKQDLFINSTLAQFGCNLIWKLFRDKQIRYHGCFVNLDSFIVNPIKIPDGKLERRRPAGDRKSAGRNKRKRRKGNNKSAARRLLVRIKKKASLQNLVRRNKSTKRKKKVRNKKQTKRS